MSEPVTLANFPTKRMEVIAAYAKNGVPFLATTRGMHSVRSVAFTVQNRDTAGNVGSFLVARRGQAPAFFNYGVNDQIELSGNLQHRATAADTMLQRGMRTPAANDLSIEWITMQPRGIKVAYVATAGHFPEFVAGGLETAEVLGTLNGQRLIVDPFAKVVPADIGASATLEQVLYHAIAPMLTLRLEWDNADRTEKMGPCSQFVAGGGASYLHANGEPSVNNRFRIPEGFLWAREGQPSGDLQAIATLEDDVAIPYTPPVQWLGATVPVMAFAYVEIVLTLGGLALRVPGSN